MASFFITGVKVGERKSMSECALAMAVQKWLNDETVWPYPVSNSFAILSRVACEFRNCTLYLYTRQTVLDQYFRPAIKPGVSK